MGEVNKKSDINSCFIFGAGDAVGTCCASKIKERDINVKAFVQDNGVPSNCLDDIEVIKDNITKLSKEDFLSMLQGSELIVYNLMPQPFQTVDENIDIYELYREQLINIPLSVLESAMSVGAKKIIFIGTYLSYFARTWREMCLKDRHAFLKAAGEAQELLVRAGKGLAEGGIDVVFIEPSLCFGSRTTVWKEIFLDRFSRMKNVCFAKGGTNISTPECIADGVVAAGYYAEHGKLLPVGADDYTYKFIINTMMETIGSPDRYKATRMWRLTDFGTILKRECKAAGKLCALNYKYLMKDIFGSKTYLHTLADIDVVNMTREYLHYDELGINTDYDTAEGIRRSMKSIYPHRFDMDGNLKAEWIGVRTTPNESDIDMQ